MDASRLKRSGLGAVAACVAVFALLLMMGSSARAAEERQFCYGANIASGSSCSSGQWWMNAAYTNSSQAPVCLQLNAGENLYNCMHNPNEGLYIYQGFCGYGHATIFNWNGSTVKAYGAFWRCG